MNSTNTQNFTSSNYPVSGVGDDIQTRIASEPSENLTEDDQLWVPLLQTMDEIKPRIDACSKKLNLPFDISFEILFTALNVGDVKKYRQVEKMGDVVQQVVLYDMGTRLDYDRNFMEKVLKQTVGTNVIMGKMLEKHGVKDLIFHFNDPASEMVPNRIAWNEKKLFANVFEALLGAAWYDSLQRGECGLNALYKIMDVFDLNFKHALQIAVDGKDCKLSRKNAKLAGKCLQELEKFEKEAAQSAWWLRTDSKQPFFAPSTICTLPASLRSHPASTDASVTSNTEVRSTRSSSANTAIMSTGTSVTVTAELPSVASGNTDCASFNTATSTIAVPDLYIPPPEDTDIGLQCLSLSQNHTERSWRRIYKKSAQRVKARLRWKPFK